ncbi:MAG TPA: flagellar biosynthetic protein FliO [Dokdonella sp.]
MLASNVRVAAAADPAAADVSPGSPLLALVVPLLAVVFALAALWWMLRRQSGRGGAAGPARIVQVLAVGPRERVLIVDHDARRFVLGVTQSRISLLADLDRKHAAKPVESASHSPNANAVQTYD